MGVWSLLDVCERFSSTPPSLGARPRPARGADSTAPAPNLGECPGRPPSSPARPVRRADAQVARALPVLLGVEHARRGARGARPGRARAAPAAAPGAPGPAARGQRRARAAPVDRHRRARPRPRRRAGARLARPPRRLAGHRQVDADEHGARAPGRRRAARTLYVSGEESAAQIRLRAERLGGRRRSTSRCWPRPTSTRCSPRCAPSARRRASSTRCRRCTAPRWTRAPGTVGQVREVADADHRGRQAPGHRRRARRAT